MRGLKLLSLISFTVIVITGCVQFGRSPDATLTEYLDATIRSDWEAAYELISLEDQAARSLEDFKNMAAEGPAQLVREKTTYKIVGVETSEDRAKAEVDVTTPDIREMAGDLMGRLFASALGGDKSEEIEAKIADKIESGNLPTVTNRESFDLRRESGEWKLFFDWATEKQISSLLEEAGELKAEKKLHGALEKYSQVLELDSTLVSAEQAYADTKEEIEVFEAKQAYVERVTLYDLKARYYETYLDKRVPGVEFKLKNSGDRTLNEVEVTVYFKDSSGTVIAEEDFHPVLVTQFSFGDSKPLRPNYVWQLERGKFYKSDSVPSEWKEGSVEAKITDIEFADD